MAQRGDDPQPQPAGACGRNTGLRRSRRAIPPGRRPRPGDCALSGGPQEVSKPGVRASHARLGAARSRQVRRCAGRAGARCSARARTTSRRFAASRNSTIGPSTRCSCPWTGRDSGRPTPSRWTRSKRSRTQRRASPRPKKPPISACAGRPRAVGRFAEPEFAAPAPPPVVVEPELEIETMFEAASVRTEHAKSKKKSRQDAAPRRANRAAAIKTPRQQMGGGERPGRTCATERRWSPPNGRREEERRSEEGAWGRATPMSRRARMRSSPPTTPASPTPPKPGSLKRRAALRASKKGEASGRTARPKRESGGESCSPRRSRRDEELTWGARDRAADETSGRPGGTRGSGRRRGAAAEAGFAQRMRAPSPSAEEARRAEMPSTSTRRRARRRKPESTEEASLGKVAASKSWAPSELRRKKRGIRKKAAARRARAVVPDWPKKHEWPQPQQRTSGRGGSLLTRSGVGRGGSQTCRGRARGGCTAPGIAEGKKQQPQLKARRAKSLKRRARPRRQPKAMETARWAASTRCPNPAVAASGSNRYPDPAAKTYREPLRCGPRAVRRSRPGPSTRRTEKETNAAARPPARPAPVGPARAATSSVFCAKRAGRRRRIAGGICPMIPVPPGLVRAS